MFDIGFVNRSLELVLSDIDKTLRDNQTALLLRLLEQQVSKFHCLALCYDKAKIRRIKTQTTIQFRMVQSQNVESLSASEPIW